MMALLQRLLLSIRSIAANDWVCDGLGIMKLKIVPRDNGNKYGDTS